MGVVIIDEPREINIAAWLSTRWGKSILTAGLVHVLTTTVQDPQPMPKIWMDEADDFPKASGVKARKSKGERKRNRWRVK